MQDKLIFLMKKGLFHIMGSSILSKIIMFGLNILVVRSLTQSDFGYYTYANNIFMIIMLLNGMGACSAILQYGSESQLIEKKQSYYMYGLYFGGLSSLLLSGLIILVVFFFPLKFNQSRVILLALSLVPFFNFLVEAYKISLRINLDNQKFSFLTTITSAMLFVMTFIGMYFFGVLGIATFRAITYAMLSLMIMCYFRKNKNELFSFRTKLLEHEKLNFRKYALTSVANSAISQLMYLLDVFFVGNIIMSTSTLAVYKTATIIPFALNFIPGSVIVFVYPYFASNNRNYKWLKIYASKIVLILGIINIAISLLLFLFTDYIVTLLFGIEYLASIPVIRVLALGYFIAGTFRIPFGNFLVMLKDLRFIFKLSVLSGVLNIILNVLLIGKYGAIGAAIATVSVFIFTSVLSATRWLYLLNQIKKGMVME